MIEKVARTLSEKTTSVDQEIELSQKGIVAVGFKHQATSLVVPTNIDSPKSLTLTPLNAAAAKALKNGWFCDFVLKAATEATLTRLLRRSATGGSNASGGADILVYDNGRLYISNPIYDSRITASCGKFIASNSIVRASTSQFRKINWIASVGSGGEEYKLLKIHSGTPVASRGAAVAGDRYARYAFEVRGY